MNATEEVAAEDPRCEPAADESRPAEVAGDIQYGEGASREGGRSAEGGADPGPYLCKSTRRLAAEAGDRNAVGGRGAGCRGPRDDTSDGGREPALGLFKADLRGFIARANGWAGSDIVNAEAGGGLNVGV